MHHLLLFVTVLSATAEEVPGSRFAGAAVAWPAGNAVISRTPMCQPDKRSELGPVRIAGIHWGGALYADDEAEAKRPELVRRIAMVHAAGARYIGSINGRGFLLDGMDEEAVRLLDGSPLTHAAMNNAVYKCSLNPKVQAALLKAARQSIDVGMDGLILDSWQGEARTLCFCKCCIEFYRQCLIEHRDDDRLKDLSGIEAGRFDYGEYLRSRGFDAKAPTHKLPGGPAFEEYRFAELIDRRRALLTEIRRYAQRRNRSPFHLTANVYSMPPFTFAIDDLLDYFSVELPYFGGFDGYPPWCSSIALLKKAHAVGKRCVVQPGCHDTARALVGRQSISTLFKIWVAEAYAAGHLFDLVPREFAGYDNGQVVWLDLPVRELIPYYAFVQAHPKIYTRQHSIAKVAVLYSLTAAKIETGEFEREYQAVCKALHDAHYQFDVILSGDGQWGKSPVRSADLARYAAVVVIRPQWVDKDTEATLLGYASGNGKLLLCGQSRAKRPGSGALCRKVFGADVAPWEMPTFVPYLKSLDPDTRDRLVRQLGPDPVLSTDAPPTVAMVCWKNNNRTIVHLLNCAYDPAADRVEPVGSFKLQVQGPARRATLHSPDVKASRSLTLQSEGRRVSCLVPGIQIYSVLVLE